MTGKKSSWLKILLVVGCLGVVLIAIGIVAAMALGAGSWLALRGTRGDAPVTDEGYDYVSLGADALLDVSGGIAGPLMVLRLNVHAHSLFFDGVYVRESTGTLAFHALGAPTFEEVRQVAEWTHARHVLGMLGSLRSPCACSARGGEGPPRAWPHARRRRGRVGGARARSAGTRLVLRGVGG